MNKDLITQLRLMEFEFKSGAKCISKVPAFTDDLEAVKKIKTTNITQEEFCDIVRKTRQEDMSYYNDQRTIKASFMTKSDIMKKENRDQYHSLNIFVQDDNFNDGLLTRIDQITDNQQCLRLGNVKTNHFANKKIKLYCPNNDNRNSEICNVAECIYWLIEDLISIMQEYKIDIKFDRRDCKIYDKEESDQINNLGTKIVTKFSQENKSGCDFSDLKIMRMENDTILMENEEPIIDTFDATYGKCFKDYVLSNDGSKLCQCRNDDQQCVFNVRKGFQGLNIAAYSVKIIGNDVRITAFGAMEYWIQLYDVTFIRNYKEKQNQTIFNANLLKNIGLKTKNGSSLSDSRSSEKDSDNSPGQDNMAKIHKDSSNNSVNFNAMTQLLQKLNNAEIGDIGECQESDVTEYMQTSGADTTSIVDVSNF